MKQQSGFSIVEVGLVVVVLIIIGGVGFMAYKNLVEPKMAVMPTVSPVSSTTPSTTVVSKADLDNADTSLDAISLDDSDSGQLNSASSAF